MSFMSYKPLPFSTLVQNFKTSVNTSKRYVNPV